ncbi:MAG TPA: FHA domain-containing protein [Promineifilum sp.]|nr:FHA domain-containing protein [Promineifilum sp.]HQF71595.1 FHA domain-containing protein [Promineifilum sp.]
MIACPECGAQHRPGTLFCDHCGAAIHPAAQAHVARTARPQPPAAADDAPQPLRRRPDTLPPTGDAQPELRVAIPHRRRDLSIRAAVIQIGRADPDAGSRPELDLTPFDGLERGVSRRHATIQWAEGGFVLIDQHSSNGTWLEGVRLVAGYAYQLPPRATVRFGDLVVQLSTSD